MSAKKADKIDWTAFEKKVKEAAESASNTANENLAGEMSTMIHLTQQEIQEIFPEPEDKKDFAALMKIVKSATSHNNKINKIVADGERFAGVVISLLKRII
ncbi:hypothetical protein [Robertkochia solimangrovi]|uniref:hypothetical protein n=1 Tax=Robertkochia solimangrovi TaxID=2213046 RepID=UPI00117E56D9|nr:hypothetical protein [Robertkochia solimangrovi]TRZ45045.1 hypothetical protein DMZ48_04605 [Robertkochia solimangrovi]